MSDPVEFLRVKLDEIEARAKAAEAIAESPWTAGELSHDEEDMVFAASPVKLGWTRPKYELWGTEDEIWGSEAVAAHVAGWHPAMALQLVAATRQVLELHFHPFDTNTYCVLCGWGEGDGNPEDGYWPCGTVKALAKGWGWTDG